VGLAVDSSSMNPLLSSSDSDDPDLSPIYVDEVAEESELSLFESLEEDDDAGKIDDGEAFVCHTHCRLAF
jgi:hypothetical protein